MLEVVEVAVPSPPLVRHDRTTYRADEAEGDAAAGPPGHRRVDAAAVSPVPLEGRGHAALVQGHQHRRRGHAHGELDAADGPELVGDHPHRRAVLDLHALLPRFPHRRAAVHDAEELVPRRVGDDAQRRLWHQRQRAAGLGAQHAVVAEPDVEAPLARIMIHRWDFVECGCQLRRSAARVRRMEPAAGRRPRRRCAALMQAVEALQTPWRATNEPSGGFNFARFGFLRFYGGQKATRGAESEVRGKEAP
jgi:hypothetical protein